MMAIEMTGGVYCPLSSRDPLQRLQTLVQQVQSRLVLVYSLTKTKFADDILSINVDSIMISGNVNNDIDHYILSNIVITPESIAYIIFTSGSTGIPKAVSDEGDNEFCNT